MIANRRVIAAAVTSCVAVLSIASCAGAPEHPHNAKAADQICGPICNREHQCDAKIDKESCLNSCKNKLSPRSIYWNAPLIASIGDCANKQTCTDKPSEGISACLRDTQARLEPTEADRTYCSKAVEKDRLCGDRSNDVSHCLYGTKIYSDAILSQLTDCLDDPCKHYGRCVVAVLGDDIYAADKDRQKEFRGKAVPQARTSVSITGKVVVFDETEVVPGTRICVHDDARVPCATTDADGKFTIIVPAAKDLPLEVIAPAPEFAPILVGFAAHAVDTPELSIGVPRAAFLVKRYEGMGAKFPDATTGFIRATVLSPKDHVVIFDDFTASIDPKSSGGPFALAHPNPKTTARTVLFAGVAPGIVEVTFAPTTLNCVPAFGAWSTGKPNVVRVPVAAGFETQVAQRCDRQP